MPQRRYCAFVSYRHADNIKEGRRWAEWLHRALEQYVVPPDLVGQPNLRGEPIPRSLYPIFRDEDELPANADLATGIRAALEASDHLIVLCSPRSAVSPWVRKEVREFKELGRCDRILAVIVAGEPNADGPGKARDGVMRDEECFCEELRFGCPSAGGAIDWSAQTEPTAADLRPAGTRAEGFVTAEAYREYLTLNSSHAPERVDALAEAYRQRLNQGLLKVIAGLLGVALGTLVDRDAAHRAELAKKELRRAEGEAARLRALSRRLAAAGMVALVLATIAFSFWRRSTSAAKAAAQAEQLARSHAAEAVIAKNEAVRAKNDAIVAKNAAVDAKNREALAAQTAEEQRQNAVGLAYRASIAAANSDLRVGNLTGAVAALESAAATGRQTGWEYQYLARRASDPSTTVFLSQIGDQYGSELDSTSNAPFAVVGGVNRLAIIDPKTCIASTTATNFVLRTPAWSPDGSLLAFREQDRGRLCIWDVRESPSVIRLRDIGPMRGLSDAASIAWSADGSKIAVPVRDPSGGDCIGVYDLLGNGGPRKAAAPPLLSDSMTWLSWSRDGSKMACGSPVVVIDMGTGAWARVGEPTSHMATAGAFSADGALLAYGDNGGNLALWDVAAAKGVAACVGHRSRINDVAWDSDGTLFSASDDQTVRHWSRRGELLETISGHAPVRSVRCGLAGRRALVTLDGGGRATISADGSGPGPWHPSGRGGETLTLKWSDPADLQVRSPGHFNSVQWGPDGKTLLLCDGGELWLGRREPISVLSERRFGVDTDGAAQRARWSPDGRSVAVILWKSPSKAGAGPRGRVLLIDADTGEVRRLLEPEDGGDTILRGLAWGSDQRLAVGSYGGTVTVWDCNNGTCIHNQVANVHIHAVEWSPDGATLAIAGEPNIKDASTNRPGLEFLDWRTKSLTDARGMVGERVSSICWGRDDRLIFCGTLDGRVGSYDPQDGTAPHWSSSGHSAPVVSLSLNFGANRLASTSRDGNRRVWDATDLAEILSLGEPALLSGQGDVSWSPDGNLLAATGANGDVTISLGTPHLVSRALRGHLDAVQDLRFSPKGKFIASGSIDRTVRIWDVSKSVALPRTPQLWRHAGMRDAVWCVDWTADGSACVFSSADGTTGSIELATGKARRSLDPPVQGKVCRRSLNGDFLAIGNDKAVELFDRNGNLVFTRPQPVPFARLAWSPTSEAFSTAACPDNAARIWTARNDSCITLSGHGGRVQGAEFSPDGTRVVTSSLDGTAKIWDWRRGRAAAMVTVNFGGPAVLDSKFSPDGRRIASGLASGQTYLWNGTTGQIDLTLPSDDGAAYVVAWAPEGGMLAVGHADGSIRLWPVDESDPIYRAQFRESAASSTRPSSMPTSSR